MGEREEYLKKCSAFGWDAEGGSGFDDSTDECRSCAEGDQKMHDACKAEALTGQVAARAQTKETAVTKDDAAKTDKQAKVQAWRDGVAAKVEAPGQEVDPAVPQETKTKKSTKSEKKKELKVTKPEMIADILRSAKEPMSINEIDAEISRRIGEGKKSHSIGWMLSFGVALGTLRRDNGKYVVA